jgi:hypothetical protein
MHKKIDKILIENYNVLKINFKGFYYLFDLYDFITILINLNHCFVFIWFWHEMSAFEFNDTFHL